MPELQLTNLSIATTIQIAVAPVFLLAGISGLLMVMTNRLGRIIDRTRALRVSNRVISEEQRRFVDNELFALEKRGRYINFAIASASTSALSVCLVIFTLFMSQFVHVEMGEVVAVLFMICMIALISALILFLGEVFVAARTMRNGLANVEKFLMVEQAKSGED